MFSYFNGGVKQNVPTKPINFDELVHLIKFNPNHKQFQEIRNLKSNGDLSYQLLKERLPNITPNCQVHHKKLSEGLFDKNFNRFSGYLYFDFDNTPEGYKDYFIHRYGHLVSLVSQSASGGGISVLFQVDVQLTKDNFNDVWQHIRNTTLKDEPVDARCSNINRSWIIPSDSEVFVNKDAVVSVNLNEIQKEKKNAIQGKILLSSFNTYTLNCTRYITKDIDEVLNKLLLKSKVPVTNSVLYFNEEYICQVYFPKRITEGNKRRIYRNIIHQLVYLNPSVEPIYIFSFINFINREHASPAMPFDKLIEFFEFVYGYIVKTGEVKPVLKLKRVHFNRDCGYTRKEKSAIANLINGLYRRKQKMDMIEDAKIELQRMGLKTTSKNISDLTGIKLRSVQLYQKMKPVDFTEELKRINQR